MGVSSLSSNRKLSILALSSISNSFSSSSTIIKALNKSEAKTALFGGDSSLCFHSSQGLPGGDISRFLPGSGTCKDDLVGSGLIGLCYYNNNNKKRKKGCYYH